MSERLSESALANSLKAATQHITIGATYRHYQGNLYTVHDLVIMEATTEVGVVYRAQYGKRITFVRALSVWNEQVMHNGQRLPRFAKITS